MKKSTHTKTSLGKYILDYYTKKEVKKITSRRRRREGKRITRV